MKRMFFLIILVIIAAGCGGGEESRLKLIAESKDQWTGVAVSTEGRIFVNYPRWSPDIPLSVAEVLPSGAKAPWPDDNWNTPDSAKSPSTYFVCVQSVYIDKTNCLWILDPANPMFKGVVEGGAKLMKFEIRSGKLLKKYIFDEKLAPKNSYLNDVRIDNDKGYAYMTDSGMGAILVLNLETGECRRLLAGHPSVMAENFRLVVEEKVLPMKVHSDGIALTPDGEYLYYQALTGRSLYRINTGHLRNFSIPKDTISKMVEYTAKTGACDGIEFDRNGILYLTSIEMNAIRTYNPETNHVETVVRDSLIKWPDSFSITRQGDIYFTTSQIHLGKNVTDPYRIFMLNQNAQ